MSEQTDEVHQVEGATELEQALVEVELALDEIFETAERTAGTAEDANGLILEQLLDLIYDKFTGHLPYDRIGLAIVEDDGAVVRSRWARSEADSVTMGSGNDGALDDDAVQELLGSGGPVIVNDLDAYRDGHGGAEPAGFFVQEGMRSSLTCPLVAGGKPIGLMVFSSKQAKAYEQRHAAVLAQVAPHVAAILERGRLYERLGELNWQLNVARDALEYQATHDGLSRLLNRNAILALAEREMDRARRQGKPITLVMCDIDHFKQVNDTHGHLIGDVVLQAVADRLRAALRSYETVGRYGGEEFLITLYDCAADDAPRAMERLRTAVGDEGVETDAGKIEVTISLGAASGTGGSDDLDTFIRAADEAMYEAKEGGRDQHRVRPVESEES